MIKVQVLTQCKHCNGGAYFPMGEAEDSQGRKYTRYAPCPMCECSGNEIKWIDLEDFAKLLHQLQCLHQHPSYQCNIRFSAGDILDDIAEVCNDCGAIILLEIPSCYIQTLMQVT